MNKLAFISLVLCISHIAAYEIDMANGKSKVRFQTNPSGNLQISNDPKENEALSSIATLGYRAGPQAPVMLSAKNYEGEMSDFRYLPERFNKLFELRNQQKNQESDVEAGNQHIYITNINKNVNDFMETKETSNKAQSSNSNTSDNINKRKNTNIGYNNN